MKLYNTLTRSIDTFTPTGDTVRMYVCGLTPYSASHVGHALRAVVFDVLSRYLRFTGYLVKHVENFTDIDDKMIARSAELGMSPEDLAEENIERYRKEMAALNVLPADVYPRATREIPKMLDMIGALVEKGTAYVVNGDVYYRVRQNPEYGKLSRRNLDSMRAGARVEVDENKQDVMDFALWKSQKPGEPGWDSPWGTGRPGWHIECSAMALTYLGETLDIHGGGQDLVFPHHENEIAQSEAYNEGATMARFWVHNGLLRLAGDKMSQSSGNFITIGEALERFSSDALRLFFLSCHYRGPATYDEEGLAGQERAAERLRNALAPAAQMTGAAILEAGSYRTKFIDAMNEDLNTPRAIAALFDLAHEINRAIADGTDVSAAQDTLRELASVLGLKLAPPKTDTPADHTLLRDLSTRISSEIGASGQLNLVGRLQNALDAEGDSGGSPEALIEALIEARSELRGAKAYDLADLIRVRLAKAGVVLEDTPQGTEWKHGRVREPA